MIKKSLIALGALALALPAGSAFADSRTITLHLTNETNYLLDDLTLKHHQVNIHSSSASIQPGGHVGTIEFSYNRDTADNVYVHAFYTISGDGNQTVEFKYKMKITNTAVNFD
ncbi:MAG: hypothetical protein AAFX90_22315, partial [Pseudomonadota bacterium]